MANFRFLHAADLHLDSPLIGLRQRTEAYASRVDDASRCAFDNLIRIAIEQECRLVVISGDVFDGQWRDYRTGLFFADRMRQLREAGIKTVMIAGNHDAENRFAARLQLAENVTLFSSRAPETARISHIEAVVHGRSFPQRDVRDNIALTYPRPVDGCFNIGLLHTACTGRDGHEPYAPCTVEQLQNHGFQYWALGHVHAHEVLSTTPHIVFPGNLQGRSVRETGPKGAMLVDVVDGRVSRVEHRALDLIRWTVQTVDVSAAADRGALLTAVREALEGAHDASDGRGLAVRIRLRGQSALHAELTTTEAALQEEIETLAVSVADDIWIERLVVCTSPLRVRSGVDPSVAGRMRRCVDELAADPWFTQALESRLTEIRAKLPAGAHADALIQALRSEAPERARDLALAMIERGGD